MAERVASTDWDEMAGVSLERADELAARLMRAAPLAPSVGSDPDAYTAAFSARAEGWRIDTMVWTGGVEGELQGRPEASRLASGHP